MSRPTKTGGADGLVPRLRFPEFRNSDAWSTKPVGSVYQYLPTNSLSRDALNYDHGHTKNIHYGDIHTKFSTLFDITHENTPYINEDKLSQPIALAAYCAEGDMVLADASEDMDDIGKSIELVNLAGERVVAGQHTILARQKQKSLVTGFGGYLFKSAYVRAGIKHQAQGSKVLGISPTRLALVGLAFPPQHAEQQKIANCLSSLDDVIAAHADKLAALKKHKQGLLEQLFPREGETVPRLRFPKFRNAPDWRPTTVGAVCDVLQGYGFPLTLQGKRSGRYPFCKVSDISRAVDGCGGLLGEAANYVDDAEVASLRAATLPVGSTVFAKIGEALRLNRRSMTTVVCLVDNNATGLKMKTGLGNDYFLFVLSQRIDMNQFCGGAVPSISKSTLESIPITVPMPDEQQRVADAFASVDALITAQFDRLATLKQHKQGLLQQLFPVIDDNATP